MTSGDDRLAPVTPLFGGGHPAMRGGRRPQRDDDGATTAGDEGWAEPGGAQADEDAHDAAAPVTALPTFAAFWPDEGTVGSADSGPNAAETSTAKLRASAQTQVDTGGDDPEETLEAAARRAENISMHALTRRGVSSSEMARTLRRRDLPDEVVAAEVERLERVGLLNDDELAETLVRSKQERKGLGKSAITAELRQRGLADEAIQQAVAAIDDDDEQERADEWARKRAGQLRGLDRDTAERRLSAYLMRRGYRSETVRRAVDAVLPRGGSPRGGVRFD